MVVDQPLVVYPKDKDKPVKHTKKKLDDVYEKWKAKKAGEKVVGEKISLSEYLRNDIK